MENNQTSLTISQLGFKSEGMVLINNNPVRYKMVRKAWYKRVLYKIFRMQYSPTTLCIMA